MVRPTLSTIVLIGLLALPAAAQDGPLATARELYASARYDEALAMLNNLRPDGGGGETRSIEQYRSLCLLALGRGTEAESAIAAVVAADPTYLPSEVEASPRVRQAFSDVRQRQLPDIARTRYASAKTAYNRKEYGAAEAQFTELLRIIDDPDIGGRLGDLRLLVAGFVELSIAAAAPPLAPTPEPKREEPPPPPPPAPVVPDPNRVYTADDAEVVGAVVLKQDVPRVPSQIASQTKERGILEVTIDELGRVVQSTIRMTIHPLFDSQLLAATRDWRYQPATMNGRPVKFRKMIQITVTKR